MLDPWCRTTSVASPTRPSASIGSIAALVLLYTAFMIAAAYLMVKYVRLGPSSLHTGRYSFEQSKAS